MAKKYVTAYAVTRHCGGPEEGGWWYDWNHFVGFMVVEAPESAFKGWNARSGNLYAPQRNTPIDAAIAKIRRRFKDVEEGDISSVLGGTGLSIYVEDKLKEFETRRRPRYE